MYYYKIIIDGKLIGIQAGADPIHDTAYVPITQQEFDELQNEMEVEQDE